jgi:hypothetical protein
MSTEILEPVVIPVERPAVAPYTLPDNDPWNVPGPKVNPEPKGTI